jgi:hypothetical protein
MQGSCLRDSRDHGVRAFSLFDIGLNISAIFVCAFNLCDSLRGEGLELSV